MEDSEEDCTIDRFKVMNEKQMMKSMNKGSGKKGFSHYVLLNLPLCVLYLR